MPGPLAAGPPIIVRPCENQCLGKRPHPTRERALPHAIAHMLQWGGNMAAYQCPHCGQWHIGHDLNRQRKEDG